MILQFREVTTRRLSVVVVTFVLALAWLGFLSWNSGNGIGRAEDQPTASLNIKLRQQVKVDGQPDQFRVIEKSETWNPAKTAVVVIDMWDTHSCQSAARRVAEMAPHANRTISAARDKGALIIHAPSDCMDFYKDAPQRKRAVAAPLAEASVKFQWNYFNPDREGPLAEKLEKGGCSCDSPEPCGPKGIVWKRQIETINVHGSDAITANGQEVYNLLQARGIDNVIIIGVHTNRCVLGRPFGIRQMVSLKKNVVLCRDLTDSFHRDPGHHFEGLDQIVSHVEKYWCPTITSESLTGQPPFRFQQAAAAKAAPACTLKDRFFEDEVWAKVGERTCLRCHNSKGDAADSDFVLSPRMPDSAHDLKWIQQNCEAFQTMSKATEGDQSRLLLKASGGLDHGGGAVLKPDSTGYRILERFVKRLNPSSNEPPPADPKSDYDAPPYFEGIAKISPQRLLRRVTLSLAGRLPTVEEQEAVKHGGSAAMDSILDRILQEDAFYVRLKEGFNDLFLTIGIEDNAETLLSYHHFEKTRLWYQKHSLDHVEEKERQRARYKLADEYRDALLREPLELIAHIVRNERPFSELATADYIMVSPYTARGYGIFEDIKAEFKNADDPFEYIPAKLKALTGRDGKTQESATGLYPHAGFLSMFHYLRRYPSTETNRNRLRARMFYQHFLGIDVMQQAPRVTDASAVAAKYKVPTMEASDCVVCHKTIDPVAGVFQDFDFEGHIGPRKVGWYQDMFQAGFEGEDMPASERWRAPQWLAERAVKDPRFPIAMVEHVYYILLGRKVLQPPEDIDDPLFGAKRRALLAQRAMIEEIARRFTDSKFNLKVAIKAMIASDFYQADGLATIAAHPQRKAEMDDIGIVRLLSPEQLERKIAAIFGKRWGRLNDAFKVLYGGIDSITVTERNADPSGAMGAIQRLMANDVSCYHVARDFRLEPSQRLLFPQIEPDVVPGEEAANQKIRQTIVALHQRLLGQDHAPDHPEIERTFQLFAGIITDAKAQGRFEARETYFCGGREAFKTDDPHYTHRAWRGVLTYLLRQHDFLYE